MAGKFPAWLRRPWASGADFGFTKEIIEDLELNTVCQSARCPNIGECWAKRTATVMVLGNICSRNCGFCSVPSGRPMPLDADEPTHVAEAVRRMGLKHAVVTTVVRDDLEDGGAKHIAQTIEAIHRLNPDTSVEILVSDYNGEAEAVQAILDARPEVFCHNVETIRRLHPKIRDRRFDYDNTLDVLRLAREYAPRCIVKTALMVGHGETPEEVEETLKDIVDTGCDVVCIGHYLRPTKQQAEVHEFVPPERFKQYEERAYALGFKHAVSGPFVRSSYRSEEILDTDFARERLALV
jgi:lipoic acid synthetase